MTYREKRQRLRTALAGPEVLLAPSCGDPLTARLVEREGFGGVHLSGSVAHRSWGWADAGLLTLGEMVERLARMADAVDIPVIADGDTGFGSAANLIRTVREYERAGAAAIHFEDQLTPKRPTHQGHDAQTVSRGEFVDKIRAALEARTDEGLVIIARSEVKGDLPEVLDRLAACIEAGADAAWLSARGSEEIAAFRQRLPRPLVGVLPQGMTLAAFGALGANCALLPGPLQVAALHAQREMLAVLRETGSPAAYYAAHPGIEEMQRFYGQQGSAELAAIEERYSG